MRFCCFVHEVEENKKRKIKIKRKKKMTMKTNEQLKERKTNQNNKQRHDFILSGYLSNGN